MKKKLKVFLLTLIISLAIILPNVIFAQSLQQDIQQTTIKFREGAGYAPVIAETALPETIGKIINGFLLLIGTLFTVLIIYGGYSWMTSMGNSEKAKKAKELIVDAVIGVAIILTAYAISGFVIDALLTATTT